MAGHCPMGIHSYGSATSNDGVHWIDHGTMMTQFDEGAHLGDATASRTREVGPVTEC